MWITLNQHRPNGNHNNCTLNNFRAKMRSTPLENNDLEFVYHILHKNALCQVSARFWSHLNSFFWKKTVPLNFLFSYLRKLRFKLWIEIWIKKMYGAYIIIATTHYNGWVSSKFPIHFKCITKGMWIVRCDLRMLDSLEGFVGSVSFQRSGGWSYIVMWKGDLTFLRFDIVKTFMK